MSADPQQPTGRLRPNIERRGRIARGVSAVVLIAAAVGLAGSRPLPAAVLGAVGLFVAFEAARGWCAVRACGLKTPL